MASCGSKEQSEKKYPPLKRLIKAENRSCVGVDAKKYENVDRLLNDFYTGEGYKDSLELNLTLGAFYFYKKNYDSALTYYLKAKNIDSSNHLTYFNLAQTYAKLCLFETALKCSDSSLAHCSNSWYTLNIKCFILGKLNRCSDAIDAGLISFKLNSENRRIYENLIICFDKLNEKDSVNKYLDLMAEKFDMTNVEEFNDLRDKYEE